MPDPADTRKEVVELLRDLQSFYGSYHNHKETMAWAGVALHSVLAIAALGAPRDLVESQAGRAAIGVGVLAAYAVCVVFVREQFKARRHAADIAAACIRLRALVLADSSIDLSPEKWAPPTNLPNRFQVSNVVPQRVLDEVRELSSVGQTARRRLMFCAYLLLLGLTVSVILRLWAVAASAKA